ncbi:MAG: DUF4269 domain-containing protein [Tenericutes bacterium]|nr:DUF4269 domain-containing protein [Mycoplasmatota bacterium]
MDNYKDISYLKNGSAKQKLAYNVLTKINVFNALKQYNPILVGTIPLGIDTDLSDLDIICYVFDFNEFKQIVIEHFSSFDNFKVTNKRENTVIRFLVDDFQIEIYAEATPTDKQNGYRHMLVEDRLLKLGGELFKRKVIELKNKNFKTEPIFAGLLRLDGNPYEELLELEDKSDEELIDLINAKTEIKRIVNPIKDRLIWITGLLALISFVLFIGDSLFNDNQYFTIDVFLYLPYLILAGLIISFYSRGIAKALKTSLILLFLFNITWLFSILAFLENKISLGEFSSVGFIQYIETLLIIGIFVIPIIIFIRTKKNRLTK